MPDSDGLRDKSVKAGEQAIKVVATTSSSSKVVITDMHVQVISAAPVQQGTLVEFGPEGVVDVAIGFDLASPHAEARALNKDRKLGNRYFNGQSEPLKSGQPLVFAISVFPGQLTYLWELEVDLTVDGQPEKRTLREADQQPFRLTGYGCKYSATLQEGSRPSGGFMWVPEDLATWRQRHPQLHCGRG